MRDEAIWLEAKGWTYYNYDFKSIIPSLTELKPMLDLWNSKYSPDNLPAWRDFQSEEFGRWNDNLILTKVEHQPFDLLYLQFGKNVKELYNQDFTGKTIRAADPSIEEDCDIEHFLRLYGHKKIGMSSGPNYWSNADNLSLQYLDLPLSNKENEITHFLTFMSVNKTA